MRKICFYGAISLDGYLADEHDSLQWLFDTPTGEETTYEAFEQQIDTTIMGRVTYEEVKKMTEDAPVYPDKTNYVYSHTLNQLNDAIVIQDDIVSFVQALKRQEGQMVWIVGGGQLVTELMEQELIDEWFIQLAPVFLGKGKRLFQEQSTPQRLTLVETKTMGELVEVHYQKNKMHDSL
ncbi:MULTISPECIES: dihydrofolate reductase family protein [Enterococcus]|uniref:PABS domain-containing protein n=1 Tax=Enterococcus sulfureus ATCC 49903 TaxID=1140003 RepID=S0P7B1_9ENTE|nr:dihydrofolate reductase family protein [Enterococcus sulfureus]EOT46512.1 hypothetical protein OMY_01661 [Enterococcus sulfureus ATCC 49903]EOT86175.1 hypothetical protein I573_00928 [Enterococcus sulfureus ATCC 49903]